MYIFLIIVHVCRMHVVASNVCRRYCPLFKSGVESLGNQLLLVEVEKSEAESVELKSEAESLSTAMEILVCIVKILTIS